MSTCGTSAAESIANLPSHHRRRVHRFMKEGHLRRCSTDALALYLVLICASDGQGLSYYGDGLVCTLLAWSRGRLDAARQTLITHKLIAFEAPLYQILEVPPEPREVKQ